MPTFIKPEPQNAWRSSRSVRLGSLGVVLACGLLSSIVAAEALVNPQPIFPDRHPYLALTPADVARARDRTGRYAWAKQALQNLTDEAKGSVSAAWDKLPAKGDTAHWGKANALFSVALAYAFTAEVRYGEWVRDGLLAYADVYPGLELTNQRCKLFTQSPLFEAMWFVPVAQAYDLVADSGLLSPEQKQHIETDLLRAGMACFVITDFQNDLRIKDLHYRCYNFQAWHLSAVGLVGLAVRDPQLVAYATSSPYGLRHLIGHDIREDGLFWERSPGYSQFVVSALLPLTEALVHAGIDAYQWQVPNDRSRDEDAHYVTDVTDQAKSLQLLFVGPFHLAFPDLSYPALGDSDRGPLRGDWTHLVGYQRYRDPRLAWLLRRDLPLADTEVDRGRLGFLHYYRYRYRYERVRLDAQPVLWERVDPTFERQGDAVTVLDGGTRQPDHYLLNDTDTADFVLEWTLTRLVDSGSDDRAWVVYHVDSRDTGNRKTFGLPTLCPELNHAYAFRLESKGPDVSLRRDGAVVATTPAQYRHAPDWHWLVHDPPQLADPGGSAAPPWADGAFANTGEFRNGCSLFPATGVVVLRQAGADFVGQPDSTAVALSYGAYGGGHGHADKLTLTLFAQGRQWLPDVGSMPYETSWKAEWTAQTVSHNTVVVDGISQKPTGERNVQWPVDSAQDRVCGRLLRFAPEAKLAAAACESAYPGLVLSRSLQVAGACVVDRFDVRPSATAASGAPAHRFDYVLHVDGALVDSTVPLAAASGKLGERCGYQHIEKTQTAGLTAPVALTYAAGNRRLRLWIVPVPTMAAGPAGAAQIVLGDGLTNQPTGRMPMIVVRREGTTATFVTVFEPLGSGADLSAVRLDSGTPGQPQCSSWSAPAVPSAWRSSRRRVRHRETMAACSYTSAGRRVGGTGGLYRVHGIQARGGRRAGSPQGY
jgi:hypothetical protein